MLQNFQFLFASYKRKQKNLYRQQFCSAYNVKYSFNNTFIPHLQNMSNAQVSLQHITFRQQSPQEAMISLYSQLNKAEDPEKVQEVSNQILCLVVQADQEYFETSLQLIIKMFSKGYANLLAQSTEVLQKIMKHFVSLFKRQEIQPTKELQYRKLFVLSVIAELIRQESKFLVPFSRDFLLKVFQIEAESLESLGQRNQLLAILGAIYGNLSKQSKLIKELKIGKVFKTAILNNYSFIEESSTFRLFNQSILQLQIKKAIIFTLCELQRYKIKDALVKLLPNNQTGDLHYYLEKIFPRFEEKHN